MGVVSAQPDGVLSVFILFFYLEASHWRGHSAFPGHRIRELRPVSVMELPQLVSVGYLEYAFDLMSSLSAVICSLTWKSHQGDTALHWGLSP